MIARYQAMVTYSPDAPTRDGYPVTVYAATPEQAVAKIRQMVPQATSIQIHVTFQRIDEVYTAQTYKIAHCQECDMKMPFSDDHERHTWTQQHAQAHEGGFVIGQWKEVSA